MTHSPGHRQWPEHKVEEKPLDQRVQVKVAGHLVADTARALELDEDNHPPRFYIPRSDVRMQSMSPSKTTTRCPFKGEAHYYNLSVNGRVLEDVAWTYEEPYDEHGLLKDYVAFHDDNPGVEIIRNPTH